MINRGKQAVKDKKEPGQHWAELPQEITFIYVFLMLAVYPFYFRNKYYDIGNAKWQFFFFLTAGVGAVLTGLLLFRLLEEWKTREFEKTIRNIRLSVIDRLVFAYAVAVLLSALFSPYKEQVIWGYDGWYMGLVAQMCFVLIYFGVSRYWRWNLLTIFCCLAAAFLVFLLAILMRFGIDPLSMYKGLEKQYIINFLSTIGQATWYSSYMAVMFPLGLFAFWFYDHKYVRIFGGIFTAAGFMTMVTQNSDSSFIAFGLLIFALFWISTESNRSFRRFLEVMMMCFSCFKFIGICQRLFPEKAVPLDAISLFCSQSSAAWILLIVTVICYSCFCWLEKYEKIDISKMKNIRILFPGIFLLGIGGIIIYIYLNTTKKLPMHLQSGNSYLLFDEYWGNNRGSSWMIAVKSFLKGDFVRKIFGCGPDGFSSFVQSFFRKELEMKWGSSGILACAHNEWLNALVNLGMAGAIPYIGIFLSAACRFYRKAKEYPELTAIMLSVICYMGHNFFCYQQIICTPIIFILIGAGESLIRYGKKEK
ncbi:MAG: O-antigen ligase family protein [Lachnospiraceae bacterium]|nr:O-antigen ligase family protein [Lachnospiraceae bacterium]